MKAITMKKTPVIIFMLNTFCLYAQIPHPVTDIDLLKGNVSRMETFHYYPKQWKPTKYFYEYDSLGNTVLWGQYTAQNEYQPHRYKYRYDSLGRIVTQMVLHGEKWDIKYDSIVYNEDNQPVQYIDIHPSFSEHATVRYAVGSNNEKIRHIEKTTPSGMTDTVEYIDLYNEHGFPTKKIRKAVTHINWNGVENYPSTHSEEYDYVGYKYDRQGNWTERKCYLNWEGKGRHFHLKEKRKIEYSHVGRK